MPVLPSAYKPNIPLSTDQLSVSQGDLLNNFGAIQALVDQNHIDFANSDAGKHWLVGLPPQTVVPGNPPTNPNPGTPAYSFDLDEFGLYTALAQPDASVPAANQLFIHSTLNGEIPSTAAAYSNNGYTYLPSGIILQWGSIIINIPQTRTVSLTSPNINFPNFIFNVQLSAADAPFTPLTILQSANRTTASFDIVTDTSGAIKIFWFAIGN